MPIHFEIRGSKFITKKEFAKVTYPRRALSDFVSMPFKCMVIFVVGFAYLESERLYHIVWILII